MYLWLQLCTSPIMKLNQFDRTDGPRMAYCFQRKLPKSHSINEICIRIIKSNACWTFAKVWYHKMIYVVKSTRLSASHVKFEQHRPSGENSFMFVMKFEIREKSVNSSSKVIAYLMCLNTLAEII